MELPNGQSRCVVILSTIIQPCYHVTRRSNLLYVNRDI